jgi:hypothetical protein
MTNNNPWDDEPEVDEVSEPEQPTGGSPFGVKLTFKRGKGYEDPWITVFGPGIREVLEEIRTHKDELKELMVGTSRMAAHFHSQAAGSQPPAGGSGGATRSTPARDEQSGQEGPDGPKYCDHGKMAFRSGVKNGKSWSGYFCTERNRDGQCQPVWPEKRGRG